MPAGHGLLDQKAKLDGLATVEGTAEGAAWNYRGAPVQWSRELDRVANLARRALDPEHDMRASEAWSKYLLRTDIDHSNCRCDGIWGARGPDCKPVPGSGCILKLGGVQGWALEEFPDMRGGFGNIGVGYGKTGIMLLMSMAFDRVTPIKRAVLMIPPSVRRQLLEVDYPQWSAHFRTPHLAGKFVWPDKRPTLQVITYSELSLPKNSEILTKQGVADLYLWDEAQNLKNPKGPRWKRILEADKKAEAEGRPVPPAVAVTGSPTDKSIKEYAHIITRCLGENAPMARDHHVVAEWASALDAGEYRAPVGKLAVLCKPGENVQEAFARRLADTKGVIVTAGASVECSLYIEAVHAPALPDDPIPGFDGRNLQDLINLTRAGERPDGEQSQTALMAAMWGRQLAAGFYSYWNFPRKEPDALIKKWFDARKAYNKEVREELKRSSPWLDMPLNLWNAAARWHDGYTTANGRRIPPHTLDGPMVVWPSECFLPWREIKDQVVYETRYKWVSEYLVIAAAEWAKKHRGIVWVEHNDFGRKVAERAGIRLYDGGDKNPELEEDGSRSAVLTVQANTVGRNLQKLWHHNLYPNPFSSNLRWEQSLGRTHRKGQRADEVRGDVYLHTAEMRRAFEGARSRARYVQATMRNPQKLCYATIDVSKAVPDLLFKETDTSTRWWETEE